MYTEKNYKTKKELKDDLAAGVAVYVYQPNAMFPPPTEGTVSLEGPHYPKPHKWYASAVIKDSRVISIK